MITLVYQNGDGYTIPLTLVLPSLFLYTVKNNYPYGVKRDRSVKRVKSYSNWSKNLLKMEWNLLKVTQVYSISSEILLFLQSWF